MAPLRGAVGYAFSVARPSPRGPPATIAVLPCSPRSMLPPRPCYIPGRHKETANG